MPSVPAVIDPAALGVWETQLVEFLAPLTQDKGDVPVTPVVVERMNIRETILFPHLKAEG